jgi:peptidoglycan hydrolase CwlO-like protein
MIVNKEITVGQLLTASLTVIGAILAFYISTSVRLTALEINANNQNLNYTESKMSNKEMSSKLDKITETINQIQISINNKQDKP